MTIIRGVTGCLKLGAPSLFGGAYYSAKKWVKNCPPCPPATYTPDIMQLKSVPEM